MAYVIFDNPNDAEEYSDECNAYLQLPKPPEPPTIFPYGWTLEWSDISENQFSTAWAVELHPEVVPLTGEIVNELPSDWCYNYLEE